MILITGPTGKIGKELVKELHDRGLPFKVMARSTEALKEFAAKGIPAVHGDFEHPESFNNVLAGIDTVFLLTIPQPEILAVEAKFLNACKTKAVRYVVRTSAMGANPWAASALIRNHGRCETQLEDSGLAWTILRPTIFMQNLVPFIGANVARESTLFAPAGEARMPWVDTRDIAAVAAQVLTGKGHEGLVYEITGPEALTYTQVAERLSTLVGRQIRYVDVPDGAALQSMLTMGMTPWMAEGLITLYHLFKANAGTALALDTVERITGRPARSLTAYLKENQAAFKSLKPVGVLNN
jgi:uncharacterized protein YbjT (DUF2867 family)